MPCVFFIVFSWKRDSVTVTTSRKMQHFTRDDTTLVSLDLFSRYRHSRTETVKHVGARVRTRDNTNIERSRTLHFIFTDSTSIRTFQLSSQVNSWLIFVNIRFLRLNFTHTVIIIISASYDDSYRLPARLVSCVFIWNSNRVAHRQTQVLSSPSLSTLISLYISLIQSYSLHTTSFCPNTFLSISSTFPC